MSTAARRRWPPQRAGPDHVIVVRDEAELLQAVRAAVAARRNVTVVLDRRKAARRQRIQPVHEERRRGERRRLPVSAADVQRVPHVLIRHSYREPPD